MRPLRFRGFTRCVLFCGIATIATLARGNAGTQIPLSQMQAGTEQTTPVQNPGFENLTAGNPNNWLKGGGGTDNMQVGTPINPAPSNPSINGSEAAQALTNTPTSSNPENYQYTINGSTPATLTFDQNTTYVLSAYMWNFAQPDPNPGNDVPDLAIVELDDAITGIANNKNVALARNGTDGGDAANGYFVYQTFQGSQFPNGATLDVRGDLGAEATPIQTLNYIYAQFDNIAITPQSEFAPPTLTPEPASLAILGIAAAFGLRRRK